MILNHLWGIYAHPLEEWQTIDNRHESLTYSLSHILLIALFPSIMGYYSSVYLGWSIGAGDPVFLTHDSALLIAVAMYFALIAGVFALAYLAHWMAVTFGSKPTFTQTLELAAYTACTLVCSVYWNYCTSLLGLLTLYRRTNTYAYSRRAWFYLCQLGCNVRINIISYYFSCNSYALDKWDC